MLTKFIPFGFALLGLFSDFIVNAQTCGTPYVRREIREISKQEWNDFVTAIRALHSGPPPTTYDKLVAIHLQYVPSAHSSPLFFPWHRRFMKEFELALQQINPNVIVPYWDWTIDSQAPEQSILFRPDYFGASGDTECVIDGPFRNWNMAVPKEHCLKRRWNKGKQIGALYPPELLAKICQQSRSFQEFRIAIEAAPHALVHANIGGNGGDVSTMWSPNDPIFWVHHAYVDKIWAYFQRLKPNIGMMYEGISNENKTVSPNDIIEPFGVTVKDVLDISDPGLCYTYSKPDVLSLRAPNSQKNRNHPRSVKLAGHTKRDNSVGPNDRDDETKLRTPSPVPESWAKMNGFNIEDVRALEKEYNDFIQRINDDDDYVSPVSLSRKNDTIRRLVEGTLSSLSLFEGMEDIPILDISKLLNGNKLLGNGQVGHLVHKVTSVLGGEAKAPGKHSGILGGLL